MLLHGCPELISTRGSQTKRCAGQNISRGWCASLVWERVGFMQLRTSSLIVLSVRARQKEREASRTPLRCRGGAWPNVCSKASIQ